MCTQSDWSSPMLVFCRPVCTPNFMSRQSSDPGACPDLPYSGPVLDVDQWPTLREPVMLVALTGWGSSHDRDLR